MPRPVAPEIREALDNLEKLNLPPLETLTPEEARVQMDEMVQARGNVAEEVGAVEDKIITGPGGGIPIRIYRPLETEATRRRHGLLPVFVYFHGGGHVIGSIETHDTVARSLSNGGQCAVVSVNYRKAPEHKFPAAPEDAYTATLWVHEHGAEIGLDPHQIVVGGDSAGANLAAVVALMARDATTPPILLQILIYPVVDYLGIGDSYEKYGEGYGLLTDAAVQYFQRHYINDEADLDDWRVSPIKAPSHLGLPPALIVAAECDVLYDDGVAYTETLRAAGVAVTYRLYEGMIHAFFNMPDSIELARRARLDTAATLLETFAAG